MLVNNTVFLKSLFFVSAVATSAFQLEHTLWLLSNMDYQIWENISHVGLWGILWASIQGI